MWRSLRRFGVAEARVDDALQLVFLAFSARLHEITPGAERSFLLSATVRIAANVRRLALRSREIPSEDLENAEPKPRTPEELLDWKQRREALDRALDALPLEQRAVFVLFELEGFSLPEIAGSLGIRLEPPLRACDARARVSKGWPPRMSRRRRIVSEPKRLLESSSAASRLLRAAVRDNPQPRTAERAALALGLGSAAAGAASAASGAAMAAVSGSVAVTAPTAVAAGTAAGGAAVGVTSLAAKWVVVGFIGGGLAASGAASFVGSRPTEAPSEQQSFERSSNDRPIAPKNQVSASTPVRKLPWTTTARASF